GAEHPGRGVAHRLPAGCRRDPPHRRQPRPGSGVDRLGAPSRHAALRAEALRRSLARPRRHRRRPRAPRRPAGRRQCPAPVAARIGRMTPADLAAFVLAGGATFALTPLVIAEAGRAGALDYPGLQKVHVEPVPTLGGLGLAAAVLGTLWILQAVGLGIAAPHAVGLTLAAVPVVAIGVWDDLRACSIP